MYNNKVLVTGGTGFLGSGLVKGLLNKGYIVKVFDNNSRGSIERLDNYKKDIEVIVGDIRDYSAVESSMKGVNCVYHLAYINGTKHFYDKPGLVLDVGVKGSINTIDAAIKNEVPKYIVASSSEVYQEPTNIPTNELERIIIPDIQNPRFSYSGGKIITELLTLHRLKGICERIIFRPHNIYGPNMGWEHVIPEFMFKIRKLSKEFKSNTIDFPIQGNGNETRAFCYIDDAIDGILICSEKGSDGEIYHLGVDSSISIKELAIKVGEVSKHKLNLKHNLIRSGSTTQRCPDITKLKKLGYRPKASLEYGLEKCWEWYGKAIFPE